MCTPGGRHSDSWSDATRVSRGKLAETVVEGSRLKTRSNLDCFLHGGDLTTDGDHDKDGKDADDGVPVDGDNGDVMSMCR